MDAEAPPATAVETLDDPVDDCKSVQLVAQDRVTKFTVGRKAAAISRLVATVLQTDPTAAEIACPEVAADVLALVVEYINHHAGTESKDIDKPLGTAPLTDLVEDKWDLEFVQRAATEKMLLYCLVRAANFLDVPGLLSLTCAYIASLVRGKPLDKWTSLLDPVAPTPAQIASAVAM